MPFKVIGQGTFGKVYQSVDVSTGHVFACKAFERVQAHMNEVNQLRRMDHVIMNPQIAVMHALTVISSQILCGSLTSVMKSDPQFW